MNIKRTDIIDAYLRNELNSEELQAFEGQLAADPSLREELGFQQQVIKGLGEFRKAELKSRLTAINIGTPWWEVGQFLNPGLVKLTGALVTATFIGTGIYYFSTDDQDVPEIQPTVFEEDMTSHFIGAVDLFEESNKNIPEPVAVEALEEAQPTTEMTDQPEVSTSEEAPAVAAESSSDASTDETGPTGEFVPEVAIPNPGDGKEEAQFKSESAKIPLASNSDIINASEQIDIKTTQRNNDEIRYKYYDGKLHLYGNFKDNPYEIIEINSPKSKQVYLFHNNRYFRLMTTDKVLSLPQITDQVLINELEIVRINKGE